jgi:hypothetical protein
MTAPSIGVLVIVGCVVGVAGGVVGCVVGVAVGALSSEPSPPHAVNPMIKLHASITCANRCRLIMVGPPSM